MSGSEEWDENYRQRGRLWTGGVTGIPPLPPEGSILELGCGNAKTIAAVEGDARRITGIDISRHALALARAAVPQATFCQADARNLPFRDGTFFAVIAYHITGHLTAAGRAVLAAEALRVLASGGVLFVREFSTGDFRCGKGTETESMTFRRGTGIYTHYFTPDELEALFAPARLISLESRGWVMRIRGKDYPREVIDAVFRRE
ncbi:methyltransferase type 11 [Methanomicrobiaceae archaeon CYW5]|uniref:class I SAM-dependent methyltransferase n=1 Tax=Methanovulcanius yangii TaxID=1789227 RepID=UPI0029C9E81E|nr:class I SAM-dependent methyltransferase [Methanovulcanius yangii]MBT8508414.1 methyltransferase type 11 [Methanovulcanius yangii]